MQLLQLKLVIPSCAIVLQSCSGTTPTVSHIRDLATTTVDSGPLKTETAYGRVINSDSSLERHAYIINDPGCPITISRARVTTRFTPKAYTDGEWFFDGSAALHINQDITAYSIAFQTFDIFGDPIRGFGVYSIADNKPSDSEASTSWRSYDENEAYRFLTVVVFVRQVRRKDGSVWEADTDSLQNAGKKLLPGLKKESLLPPQSKKP